MTQRLQSFVIPTGSTNNVIAGVLNQFFQINPEVTLQDISIRFEERGADYRYQIVLAYDTEGGTTYGAVEFVDDPQTGQTASAALTNWFLTNSQYDLLRTWDITRSKSRFTHPTRILAIYQPRAEQYLTLANVHFAGQSEETIIAGLDGQFSQLSNVAVTPDRLEAYNAGGANWPSQTNGVLVNTNTPGHGGVNCCGTPGADDVQALPTPPVGAACNAGGPPAYFDPPDPGPDTPVDPTDPVKNNCCLTYDYVCQCIGGIDTWVLTSIQCLPNALCTNGWFYYTWTPAAIHYEHKYTCRCGAAVPTVLLPPPIPPGCCIPPPPPVDCCLKVVFDCVDVLQDDICTSKWELTSIECLDNGDCPDGTEYLEDDLDGDEYPDHVEYTEQGACECGEDDQDTLLQLLPNDLFDAQADDPIRVPAFEAKCCPDSCCVHIRYICVEEYGESVWQFDFAECISNDSEGCESPGAVWSCDADGEWAEVFLRSGCECEDQGALTQATSEGLVNSDVNDECTPDCLYWDCVYTWESTWDCISQVWGDPVLVATDCQSSGTATDWAYMGGAGNECKATRKTLAADACTANGSDCPSDPEPPDAPTLGEPSDCCYDCVYHWESEWDCDLGDWGDPVETSRECVSGGVEEDWDYDANPGRECFAIRTTVQENLCTINESDCPDPE